MPDFNIPTPQITSPLALMAQVGGIQQQQQNLQRGGIALTQEQQGQQDDADGRAAMAAATKIDPTTGQYTVDRPTLLSTLAKLNPTRAAQTATALTQQDTAAQTAQANLTDAQQKAQQAQLATAKAHVDMKDQLLQGATDEPSYQNARNLAIQNGISPNEMPPTYNPQWVAQAHAQTLTQQNQIANAQKVAEQAENVRKDTATEAQTAATQQNTQAYRQADLGVRRQQVGIAGGELALKQQQTGMSQNGQPSDLAAAIAQGHVVPDRLGYLLSRNPTLIQGVMAADPTFDSSKAASYANTYKDFTSGKTSVALNAGGTALQHLQELQGMNTAESHIPGTADYNAYQNKADTVSAELARFYGTDTVPGIAAIKSTLTSQLPGTRDAAISTQAKSMGDKLDSYQQTWQNAAPSAAYQAPMPGISPKAIAARAALDPDYKPVGTASSTPTPQTHQFSVSAWQRANPNGNANAAKAAATAQGYQVAP